MKKLVLAGMLTCASYAHAQTIPSFQSFSDYSMVCESRTAAHQLRVWFDVKPSQMKIHMTDQKGESWDFPIVGTPMVSLHPVRNEFGHPSMEPYPVQFQFQVSDGKLRAITWTSMGVLYTPVTESGWLYDCVWN